MSAKRDSSDKRTKKRYRTRRIRRSASSPYHALPFRSSSLGSIKAHDILSQSQPIHSRKAVSVLKTRNIPSTVSPISSPTRVNTKFVPRKRKVRSTRELEEYETLKLKYQQKKETSRKSLRKGFTFPRYAFNQTDEIVRRESQTPGPSRYNLGLKFKPSPGVGALNTGNSKNGKYHLCLHSALWIEWANTRVYRCWLVNLYLREITRTWPLQG